MGLLSTIGAASGRAFGLTRVGAAIRDAYFNLVTLLLPGNGTNGAQNNTFLDSSSNAFSITRNGNTTQGTFSPFSQTGWSNFFNGSSYLQAGSNAALAPGSGNFTVEFWVFPTAGNTFYNALYQNYTDGLNRSTAFRISINNADATSLLVQTQASALITTSTGVLTTNAWNHVALVRNGSGSNNLVLYVNGVSVGTATNTTNFSDGFAQIGNTVYNATNYYWNGYISNFRVVPGTAVYTAAFTPPTSPLTAISGTALLTCQSNRFIDNSSNAFAITVNGTPSVQAFSPFAPTAAYSAATNGGSGYFDGTGDYLDTAYSASLSGNYSIETWFYLTTVSAQSSIFTIGNAAASTGLALYYSSTSNQLVVLTNGSATITTGSALKPFTWYHIALVRSGSSNIIYLNGVQVGSTWTSSATFSGTFRIGIEYTTTAGATLNGYLSSFRVSNTNRTITVPTAPYTSDANTNLLLNFTNAGITDATAKNVLETVGNAQISTTQSKFGGSSMYFDGTGDYITFPASQNFNLTTGDFTIECWFYYSATPPSGSDYDYLWGIGANNTNGLGLYIQGGVPKIWNGSLILTTTGSISATTWYHLAVVRSSGTLTVYLNGTSIGSVSMTSNLSGGASVGFNIARWVNAADINEFTGYIDDLRITKGYARYTTTFTPPTQAFALQ